MAPKQKPHKSKQDYGTPDDLLTAIKMRLCIEGFGLDIAASPENAVCKPFYTEEMNALSEGRPWRSLDPELPWSWLNPPYTNIYPWAEKAAKQAQCGAQIIMLVPASPGSQWWFDWVTPYAYVTYLHGRPIFKGTPINPKTGKQDAYPKDCALLLYTPYRFTGTDIWKWKEIDKPGTDPDLSQLPQRLVS